MEPILSLRKFEKPSLIQSFPGMKGIVGGLTCVILAAIGLKIWLIATGRVPFNADEAIVGLMARHILEGEFPIFFYGQAYMGSLDAWLIALGFTLLGPQVWVIRAVQSVLYAGTLVTTVLVGREGLGDWGVGLLAAGLLAVPNVNMSLYTTASLGNYGEALLLGNLIIISALRIANRIQSGNHPSAAAWLGFGALAGIGFWAFGLTLVYTIPAGVYLGWSVLKANHRAARTSHLARASLPAIFAGFILGSFPIWIFIARGGVVPLVGELAGGAISGVSAESWLESVGQHLFNFLLLGTTVIFGLRPPWEVRWMAVPLLPLVLAFWTAVMIYSVRSVKIDSQGKGPRLVLLGISGLLGAAFVLSPFGADPSGRYFLPLTIILSLFAADMILWLYHAWGNWVWVLPVLLLAFNLLANVQSALRYPPGLTTQFDQVSWIDHQYDQALLDFLREHGEIRGYTNYWVSYPLAFLSREELIFTPNLPYHPDFRYTTRDDRYEPYRDLVSASTKVAYITTHHPTLNEYLRDRFTEQEIGWKEVSIGDYRVFYDLTEAVAPLDLGLGVTTP